MKHGSDIVYCLTQKNCHTDNSRVQGTNSCPKELTFGAATQLALLILGCLALGLGPLPGHDPICRNPSPSAYFLTSSPPASSVILHLHLAVPESIYISPPQHLNPPSSDPTLTCCPGSHLLQVEQARFSSSF